MSGYVWVSTARRDADLILPIETDRTDGPSGDQKTGLPIARSIWRGARVEQDECPTTIWARPKFPFHDEPPNLFCARAFFFVSGAALNVLANFDMGAGAFYPVTAYRSDLKTRFFAEFFCWVFGNSREALDLQATGGVQPNPRPDEPGYRFLDYKISDGDIKVDSAALSGPDVWFDPRLTNAFFLSAALGDALAEAEMRKDFRLVRADVLPAS